MPASDDLRVDRMARLVVERMLRLREGQQLLLAGAPEGLPLLAAIGSRAAALGASVLVQGRLVEVDRAILEAATDAALARPDRLRERLLETADAYCEVWASQD